MEFESPAFGGAFFYVANEFRQPLTAGRVNKVAATGTGTELLSESPAVGAGFPRPDCDAGRRDRTPANPVQSFGGLSTGSEGRATASEIRRDPEDHGAGLTGFNLDIL